MKFYQVLMTLTVLLLVILGLNISNQGINKLTLDRRGAILAGELTREDICLQVLGYEYAYPRDKLGSFNQQISVWGRKIYRDVYAYPAHYRAVLDALLGSGRTGAERHD